MERWDPFGESSRFRELVDRMFGESWPRFVRVGQIGSNVAMDICEMDDEVLIRAAIPGCRPEDLDITVKEDILTIRGDIKAPDYTRWEQPMASSQQQPQQTAPQQQPQQQPMGGAVQRERTRGRGECWLQEIPYGRFARSITLPVSVNAGNARAEFQDGLLILHVPKAEEAKPRRIEIRSGSQQLSSGNR